MTPAAKHLLLTGKPNTGKTTAIRKLLARLNCNTGGFYTQEMREDGARRGFKMIALDGREAVLAHATFQSPYRIARYGVDVAALDAVGVDAIRRAANADLIVIDEIGPMETFSSSFRQAVLAALTGDVPVLGTVVWRSTPFGDAIKARHDVRVLELTLVNRDRIVDEALAFLQPLVERSR